MCERVDLGISVPWPPSMFTFDDAEDDGNEEEHMGENDEEEEEEDEEDDEEEGKQEEDEADHQENEEEGFEGEGDRPSKACRGEPPAKRGRSLTFYANREEAYLSLCATRYGECDDRLLSPRKILAHQDLDIVIKMLRAYGKDEINKPMTRMSQMAKSFLLDQPMSVSNNCHKDCYDCLCMTCALPEGFFSDGKHDLAYLFKDLSKIVNAMRRVVAVLPRGEGLGRATRAYFGLLWKQDTPWGHLRPKLRSARMRALVVRIDS